MVTRVRDARHCYRWLCRDAIDASPPGRCMRLTRFALLLCCVPPSTFVSFRTYVALRVTFVEIRARDRRWRSGTPLSNRYSLSACTSSCANRCVRFFLYRTHHTSAFKFVTDDGFPAVTRSKFFHTCYSLLEVALSCCLSISY